MSRPKEIGKGERLENAILALRKGITEEAVLEMVIASERCLAMGVGLGWPEIKERIKKAVQKEVVS